VIIFAILLRHAASFDISRHFHADAAADYCRHAITEAMIRRFRQPASFTPLLSRFDSCRHFFRFRH
jgi:hypothetical protein